MYLYSISKKGIFIDSFNVRSPSCINVVKIIVTLYRAGATVHFSFSVYSCSFLIRLAPLCFVHRLILPGTDKYSGIIVMGSFGSYLLNGT